MQKGFVPILILIGVLVMVVVTGGVYYFIRFQTPELRNQTVIPQASQIAAAPQPTLASDETVNWKTYVSKDGQYSIKYPAGSKLLENQVGTTDGMLAPAKDTIEILVDLPERFAINVHFTKLVAGLSLEEAIRNECAANSSVKAKPYAVDGKQALLFEDNVCGLAGNTNIYVLNDNILYDISQPSGPGGKSFKEIRPYFEKVLSTYKFLDQNLNNETANWRVFSSSSLGISFKYPLDKNLQEYLDANGKSIVIGVPNSDYSLGITFLIILRSLV